MLPLDIQNPTPKDLLDSKSMLQIKIQQDDNSSETGKRIKYKTISISGKSPNQMFTVQVSMDDKILGIGTGSKKSQAEQNAAAEALSNST